MIGVRAATRLFTRVALPTVIKPVIGGLAFGLIGFALPLTNFTGSEQLGTALQNAGSLGIGLMVAILLGKIIAFAISSASGFIGGPIFPILFLGGLTGIIVNAMFPDIPLGLAFSCMLAAVPGSIVAAPFSMVLLAALLTQVGPLQTAPILIAVGTAWLTVAGIKFLLARRASVGGTEPA
jgi:H+/Cl- antiporter ClcA